MTPARLDATFAALADPTRRAILARLCLAAEPDPVWPFSGSVSVDALEGMLEVAIALVEEEVPPL